jgi:hypothetical protein
VCAAVVATRPSARATSRLSVQRTVAAAVAAPACAAPLAKELVLRARAPQLPNPQNGRHLYLENLRLLC